MKIRAFLVGALLCAPPMASTAVAQTPSPSVPARAAPTAAPAPIVSPAASSTPAPASPFMPSGTGGTEAGAGGAASGPSPAATAVPVATPTGPPAPPKPKTIARPPPPLESALSTDPEPTYQPNTFFATAKASERYAAIVDA